MTNNVWKIYVYKEGNSKKIDYTMRFIPFDPGKKFISTPEAKDLCRKDMHCSKKKMAEEYDSMYGIFSKVGRGKNAKIGFNRSTKDAANVIFVVPKKKRREAWRVLEDVLLPYDKEVFK